MRDDEHATAELLHLAGPRPEVPAERAARVREAVHGRWQAGARRHAMRRRVWAAATLVATAATVVLLVRVGRVAEGPAPLGDVLATVERVEGTGSLWPGTAVRVGEWVETGATARATLRLGDGTSLRLDRGSRARLTAPTVIELTAGAAYLDTARDSTGLEVRTPLGTAHDIGTQFEVRLEESILRISVRSGIVELRRGGAPVAARAGTSLTVSATGAVSQAIAAHGPEWAWAASMAPAFAIEGRTVAAFLDHVGREQGWTLRYADAGLTRDASAIILHGSVAGLVPRDAVSVALSASGLGHRFDGEELLVFRDRDVR